MVYLCCTPGQTGTNERASVTPSPKKAPPISNQIKRDRAAAKWDKPLEGSRARTAAWLDMMLVDHGFIRSIYLNKHRLGPRAWRAAQPSPAQLKWFAKAGVKSVVSLRGGMMFGSLPLEREACARLGMTFHIFPLYSRDLPKREVLLDFIRFIREIEHPVLYHCKSGADRAGFASVLHAHVVDGVPVEEARQQLSVKFGHFRQAKTGVLDAFFDTYLAERGERDISLEDWIATEYDRMKIKQAFREVRTSGWFVDRVLKRE